MLGGKIKTCVISIFMYNKYILAFLETKNNKPNNLVY